MGRYHAPMPPEWVEDDAPPEPPLASPSSERWRQEIMARMTWVLDLRGDDGFLLKCAGPTGFPGPRWRGTWRFEPPEFVRLEFRERGDGGWRVWTAGRTPSGSLEVAFPARGRTFACRMRFRKVM